LLRLEGQASHLLGAHIASAGPGAGT
jgi:hypothetical protein